MKDTTQHNTTQHTIQQYQIFGFKIAIDDASLMKMFDAEDDLGGVEADAIKGEGDFPLQVLKQLTAIDVLHHKVELVGSLEDIVELYQERVVEHHQDPPLGQGVGELVSLHDVLFIQLLHRIDLPCRLVLDLHHLPKATYKKKIFTFLLSLLKIHTPSDYSERLEVLDTHFPHSIC